MNASNPCRGFITQVDHYYRGVLETCVGVFVRIMINDQVWNPR